MAKFEFKKQQGILVPLDIAGHKFTLFTGEETSEKLTVFGVEAQRLGSELPATPAGEMEAWDFMKKSLDGLLGTGATDTIFEGRQHNLNDIVDVLTYICDEIEQTVKRVQVMQQAEVPAVKRPDTVQQTLRVLQNPEVMASIAKAMQE